MGQLNISYPTLRGVDGRTEGNRPVHVVALVNLSVGEAVAVEDAHESGHTSRAADQQKHGKVVGFLFGSVQEVPNRVASLGKKMVAHLGELLAGDRQLEGAQVVKVLSQGDPINYKRIIK
jgi:hypothetical protein